jgi:PAS domain S-box-containing protein
MFERQFERRLTYLLHKKKGGENRIRLLNVLREQPLNLNQLAVNLNLNYRTIKHHVDILLKEDLISTANKGSYGSVFFISPELESNLHVYDRLLNKYKYNEEAPNMSADFYQSVMQQMSLGVIVTDDARNIIFFNGAATGILGLSHTNARDRINYSLARKILQDRELDELVRIGSDVRDFIKEVTYRDGSAKLININVSTIRGEKGQDIGHCYIIKDVTSSSKWEDYSVMDPTAEDYTMPHPPTETRIPMYAASPLKEIT